MLLPSNFFFTTIRNEDFWQEVMQIFTTFSGGFPPPHIDL